MQMMNVGKARHSVLESLKWQRGTNQVGNEQGERGHLQLRKENYVGDQELLQEIVATHQWDKHPPKRQIPGAIAIGRVFDAVRMTAIM